MGAWKKTIESVIEDSDVNLGYRADMPIPLAALMNASGEPLSASTSPEIEAIATSMYGIKWDHGDTAATTMEFTITVPGEWAQDEDDLIIVLPIRKVDSADENADLCFQAQIFAFKAGLLSDPSVASGGTPPTLTAGESSLVTLTTPAKSLLHGVNASSANSNLLGFGLLELDIGARLAAEGKTIKAGATLRIVIGPDDTVGATDMDVECMPPVVRFRRHANLYRKADRFQS
jgi:hypothetical protein